MMHTQCCIFVWVVVGCFIQANNWTDWNLNSCIVLANYKMVCMCVYKSCSAVKSVCMKTNPIKGRLTHSMNCSAEYGARASIQLNISVTCCKSDSLDNCCNLLVDITLFDGIASLLQQLQSVAQWWHSRSEGSLGSMMTSPLRKLISGYHGSALMEKTVLFIL